jgi:tRNA (guanine37-N1)-methyltransferase
LKGNLKSALEGKLPPHELALVYRSYDVIGDIAVIRIPEQLVSRSTAIAETLMQQHKHVKAVWRQSGPVSGSFRLRKLTWIAGERKAETTAREHGCVFKVDVEKCYYSPRLAFERMRIAKATADDDVIVNMFAGVGSYSILIAKHSNAAKIYSIDLNPVAVKYMRENTLLNKVSGRVFPIGGDAEVVIRRDLQRSADRVIMPLPERAYEYLDSALLALKPIGGWIHYYDFEYSGKSEDPLKKVELRVAEKLNQQSLDFSLQSGRVVRQTGPNWHQVAIDIKIDGCLAD